MLPRQLRGAAFDSGADAANVATRIGLGAQKSCGSGHCSTDTDNRALNLTTIGQARLPAKANGFRVVAVMSLVGEISV